MSELIKGTQKHIFTMQGLNEIGDNPKFFRKDGFILTNDQAFIRPIPLAVLRTAHDLQQSQGSARAILYTRAAFEIYRSAVSGQLITPHVLVNDAYEFPRPAMAPWDNVDFVMFIGQALGAFNNATNPLVMYKEGAKQVITDIVTEETRKVEVSELVGNTGGYLPFEFPDFDDIQMTQMQAWQNWALRGYATGLMRAAADIQKGTADDEKISTFFDYMQDECAKEYNLPTLHYAKPGEMINDSNIIRTDF